MAETNKSSNILCAKEFVELENIGCSSFELTSSSDMNELNSVSDVICTPELQMVPFDISLASSELSYFDKEMLASSVFENNFSYCEEMSSAAFDGDESLSISVKNALCTDDSELNLQSVNDFCDSRLQIFKRNETVENLTVKCVLNDIKKSLDECGESLEKDTKIISPEMVLSASQNSDLMQCIGELKLSDQFSVQSDDFDVSSKGKSAFDLEKKLNSSVLSKKGIRGILVLPASVKLAMENQTNSAITHQTNKSFPLATGMKRDKKASSSYIEYTNNNSKASLMNSSHRSINLPIKSNVTSIKHGCGKIASAAEEPMDDMSKMERKCNCLWSSEMLNSNAINDALMIREKLEEAYRKAMQAEKSLIAIYSLERRLWKSVFYTPVKILRQKMNDNGKNGKQYKNAALSIIVSGMKFYKKLLLCYQEICKLKIEEYVVIYPSNLDCLVNGIQKCSIDPTTQQVLNSMQRCAVCLGDLARYELGCTGKKSQESEMYYQMAIVLGAFSSYPYNRLAVLGIQENRKLDAVYYFIRSIALSVSSSNSTEHLRSIFNDTKEEISAYEDSFGKMKHHEKKKSRSKKDEMSNCFAQEVWYSFEGIRIKDYESGIERGRAIDEILISGSTDELYRRCVAYILHLNGILFTKIDVDTFPNVARTAMIQFVELLRRAESPLTAAGLLKLILITLFTVQHIQMKMKRNKDDESCLVLLQLAVRLTLNIFTILLFFIEKQLEAILLRIEDASAFRMLPALHIMCRWFSLPSSLKLIQKMNNIGRIEFDGLEMKLWASFMDLCKMLLIAKTEGKLCFSESQEGDETIAVHLPEDCLSVALFVDFERDPPLYFIQRKFNKSVVMNHLRLESVLKLGGYLNVNNIYINRDIATVEAEPVDELLNSSKKEEEYDYELHIYPQRLVIDTNTFVDHLKLIIKLIKMKKYTILIPLVVFNELYGLGKYHESDWVQAQCTLAMKLIKEWLQDDSLHVRGVTTSGTLIKTFNFFNEATEKIQNDDKILHCCQMLINNKSVSSITASCAHPEIVHRDVVLLTDDRNLRLKAYSMCIPARTLQSFFALMKLG
ncbi:Telomerase-binding protein EST1A [Trichinella papuae]|uniref:Telomerase-binding protein EST1A n=1 Tax=Trichinella papuae TaxID=268474 RepID=A0A0V1NA04_9BILA|nr:Telomerase-binding protein EST1A [Trichinella papuae]